MIEFGQAVTRNQENKKTSLEQVMVEYCTHGLILKWMNGGMIGLSSEQIGVAGDWV